MDSTQREYEKCIHILVEKPQGKKWFQVNIKQRSNILEQWLLYNQMFHISEKHMHKLLIHLLSMSHRMLKLVPYFYHCILDILFHATTFYNNVASWKNILRSLYKN